MDINCSNGPQWMEDLFQKWLWTWHFFRFASYCSVVVKTITYLDWWSDTAWRITKCNPFLLKYLVWLCWGGITGMCVPSMLPLQRGKPHRVRKPQTMRCRWSPTGILIYSCCRAVKAVHTSMTITHTVGLTLWLTTTRQLNTFIHWHCQPEVPC